MATRIKADPGMAGAAMAAAVAEMAAESVGARVRRLQQEARGLARSHVEVLSQEMAAAYATADEIARGGDAYPPGVRDLARQLAEKLEADLQSLQAIMSRVAS